MGAVVDNDLLPGISSPARSIWTLFGDTSRVGRGSAMGVDRLEYALALNLGLGIPI